MTLLDDTFRHLPLARLPSPARAEMIAGMPTAFPNLIAGRSVDSAERTPDINPSNVHDIVGEFARGTAADVEQAVASAKQAFAKWSMSNPQERFDILDRAEPEILARKEELGRQLSREMGKPLADAMGEAGRAGAIFKYSLAKRCGSVVTSSTRCGPASKSTSRASQLAWSAITPWNFPLAIPAEEWPRRSHLPTAWSSSQQSWRPPRRGPSSTSCNAPGYRPASSIW